MLLYCLIGFIATLILGFIFHFAYEWTKYNKFVGFFTAVNESTWEHLKLAFLPIFIWALVGIPFGFNNFAIGIFASLLVALVTIPAMFYLYMAILKKDNLFLDISIFTVSVALAIFTAYNIFSLQPLHIALQITSIVGIVIFAIAFALFTIFPPKIFFFEDPLSNTYGIRKIAKKIKQ